MSSKQTFEDSLVDQVPYIRRIVRRIAKNSDVVDDISQEVCVRIIEKEKLWNKNTNQLSHWMNAVARNLTIDYLSKKKLPTSVMPDDLYMNLEQKTFSEEQIKWVLQQFSSLSKRHRKILNMRYYQKMKVTDIASTLNISQPAASQQLAQALKVLRKKAKNQNLLAVLLSSAWDFKTVMKVLVMNYIKVVAILVGVIVLSMMIYLSTEQGDGQNVVSEEDEVMKFQVSKNESSNINKKSEMESEKFQFSKISADTGEEGSAEKEEGDSDKKNTHFIKDYQEIYKLIGSNRTLVLDPLAFDANGIKAEYDEKRKSQIEKFNIDGVKNLVIKGSGGTPVDFLIDDMLSFVMEFKDVENLVLENLNIGHVARKGDCMGGVVRMDNCKNIKIINCILFGCGTVGLKLNNVHFLEVNNSTIKECTVGGMVVDKCSNIKFNNCEFYDNNVVKDYTRQPALVSISKCEEINFLACTVRNNTAYSRLPLFYVSASSRIEYSQGAIEYSEPFSLIKNKDSMTFTDAWITKR